MIVEERQSKSNVLLSFNKAFQQNALRLANELKSANITVFYDQWEGGGGVPADHISDLGIEQVQIVIPLISVSDVAASWIAKEWIHEVYDPAIKLGIRVLAVKVSHCDVPEFLSNKSFADFANRNYDHELRRLLTAIGKCAKDERIQLSPAKPVIRTLEPQKSPADPLIVLEFSQDMAAHFLCKAGMDKLGSMLDAMFDGLFYELGVQYPEVGVSLVKSLPSAAVILRINSIPEGHLQLRPDQVLVNERPNVLQESGINAAPGVSPVNGASWAWIEEKQILEVEKMGHTTFDLFGFLILSLSALLRKKAAAFISIDQSRLLLKKIEVAFPALVRETVPINLSLFILADVLRRLVEEGISIRNMRSILLTLADWGRVEHDPHVLAEYVRAGLQRQITQTYSRGTNSIVVVLLDPKIEQLIRGSIKHLATGSYLDLSAKMLKTILDAIEVPFENLDENMQKPQILTTIEIRSCVRRLIANSLPHIHVISYYEIRPDITIQPLCRISLDGVNWRTNVPHTNNKR